MLILAFEPELEALRDIRMPEPVSRAPQTYGWWILAVVVLVGAVLVVRAARRHWRAQAYRRRARALHAELAARALHAETRADALAALPGLLKRTALQAWPREEVASLSDEAWLAFLDRTYPGQAFERGPGRVLATLAYGQIELTDADVKGVLAATEAWIGGHRA
ncbi:MAG: DUF4381 domain-containing protein [Planctomycetota bacterium]|nr:DUF4381 domain-containing protein [Planctomycetota bacterium]